MSEKLYGQLQSERHAQENTVAREIVNEISRFGITERQRWMIIYMLALELENVDDLRELTKFIKDRKGDNVFLTGRDSVADHVDA